MLCVTSSRTCCRLLLILCEFSHCCVKNAFIPIGEGHLCILAEQLMHLLIRKVFPAAAGREC